MRYPIKLLFELYILGKRGRGEGREKILMRGKEKK